MEFIHDLLAYERVVVLITWPLLRVKQVMLRYTNPFQKSNDVSGDINQSGLHNEHCKTQQEAGDFRGLACAGWED